MFGTHFHHSDQRSPDVPPTDTIEAASWYLDNKSALPIDYHMLASSVNGTMQTSGAEPYMIRLGTGEDRANL